MTSSDRTSYEKTFFYYNEDKTMDFNEGLLVQKYRANANYTVFDKNFDIYQFVKHYKSVLYSKRNKEFANRIELAKNETTPWNENNAYMKYQFHFTGNKFIVTIRIPNVFPKKFYQYELRGTIMMLFRAFYKDMLIQGY